MILFLIKGLLRDRSRSFFPVLIVAVGVALTVILQSWLNGTFANFIGSTANFQTGHVKVTTRAVMEQNEPFATDLAMLGLDSLLGSLNEDFPELRWHPRIQFGGLLDIPDESGETLIQAPAFGMAIDLFNPDSTEIKLLGIQRAMVRGKLPAEINEILVSESFAQRLGVGPGDTATLISSTMYGSMAFYNFKIAGTLTFGMAALDRGAIIADFHAVQLALDMPDGAMEILGFYRDDAFDTERTDNTSARFNQQQGQDPLYAFLMTPLQGQNGLRDMLSLVGNALSIITVIFIFIMFLVLWNAGLRSSIRRYGEIGVRLAMGETHMAIYRSLVVEAIAIGGAGSILGTAIGLAGAYYLQINGIDISAFVNKTSMMFEPIIRAKINGTSFWVGWIPGMIATVFGASASGLVIFKRETAQLFKELE